ncbi:MAG: acyl-CoA dehydrogenase family protein [Candidatus Binatia bacterium]
MDLGFNEEQQSLKASARKFLANECTPALLRQLETDASGFPRALWEQMAQLAWLGLPFAERYGGAGADLVTLAALVEELGRACDPTPYVSTVVASGLLLQDAASEAQKQEFLPRIGRGAAVVSLAVLEAEGRYAAHSIGLSADAQGSAFVLNGSKLFVDNAHIADRLLVAARTASGADPAYGITLLLVDPKSAGISLSPLPSLGHGRLSEVRFDRVRVPREHVVGTVHDAWPQLATAIKRAAAIQCAAAVGGAQRVLEMAVDYVKVRVQFDKPLGSFQAVHHHCADMWMDVETAWLATYQAVCELNEGRAADEQIAIAKAWTSEVYTRTCLTAHQLHGGIGFMMEYDLQLWTRQAKATEAAWGSPDWYRRQLATML